MSVPSTSTAIVSIARVTLRRLTRSKLPWISALIAALPAAFASFVHGKSDGLATTFGIARLLLVVLPPLYIASAIGDDIDDRTATYLWSRPLARWTVIAGKLLALSPIVAVLMVAGWYVACDLAIGHAPTGASLAALGAGAIAVCFASAGIATLLPRHGMALSIVYVLADLLIGELPASLHALSITHQVKVIAGLSQVPSDSSAWIALAVIPVAWLTLGVRRISRVEA